MPDQIASYKLICSGGLNSNENHLDLSENFPGAATRLVNFEPSLFGGYRRIEGFSKYDSTYGEVSVAYDSSGTSTGQGPVLGIAIYKDDSDGSTTIIAARKDIGSGGNYSFYYFTSGIGWRKFTLDHSVTRPMTANGLTVTKLRHAQFNFGAGNTICFVDGVNPAIVYNGSHWEELKSTNAGGYTAGTSHNNGASTGGGDQVLNAPAVVDVFENHLFFSGHQATNGAIAHSAPNTPYEWDASAGGGQIVGGFEVTQIKPFRDNLYVFGSNGIKKITVNASGAFVIDNVTNNVGCVARDSVLEIGGDLMFLAPDGFRPVASTSRIGDVELETLSKSIQATLVDVIKNNDMKTLNGVVIRSKSQVRYFFGPAATNTEDSTGIVGGLTSTGGTIDWSFGELLGIRASCCTSDYIGTEEVVLHGDHDGNVYQQEQGKTFNGEDILALYSTPYLDFGETEQRKQLKKLNTFIRAEGPLEMLLSVTYDWGDSKVLGPSTYTQTSSGAPTVYAGRNITYNATDIIYGGNDKPVMTSDVQGSGFSVQASFVTIGQTEPYSIQGMVFEYSVAGRR